METVADTISHLQSRMRLQEEMLTEQQQQITMILELIVTTQQRIKGLAVVVGDGQKVEQPRIFLGGFSSN